MSAIQELAFGDVEMELAKTRIVLSRIPDEHLDWQPHEKSMTLGALGAHIVNMLFWQHVALEANEFDLASVPPGQDRTPDSTQQLLDTFEKHVDKLRDLMAGMTEESLEETWTLRMGEQVVFQMPRATVFRMGFSHIAHHRGQMTVFFRLLGVPVPNTYGPTADEE